MILIDPRVGTTRSESRVERLDRMVNALRRKVQCPVRVAKPQLAFGDICFSGNGPDREYTIGIELKELRDFLGSMRSERLAGDQIAGMSTVFDAVYVIVQGIFRPGDRDLLMTRRGKDWTPVTLAAKARPTGFNRPFYYGEMFKHMNTLAMKKNVVVLISHTEEETLCQIAHLYAWWALEWDAHKSADPVKLQSEVVFYKVSLLRKMAAELPGIGWNRSKSIEQAFGSVHRMVNAPVEAWESIEGIGPKIARNVWKVLRERA